MLLSFARIIAALSITLLTQQAYAADAPFTVKLFTVPDEKPIFATIESANVVPARVRTGGTITALYAHQGDAVKQGDVLAVVGDKKLALQTQGQQAQIDAARAQMQQINTDLQRAKSLLQDGYTTKSRVDGLQAAYDAAKDTVSALSAQRSVTGQQQTEGAILAPTSGRVLTVPVTVGTVVMPGETVATLAQQDFIVRLDIPERHAAQLKSGDPVRILEVDDKGRDISETGTIKLIYPHVENGRVQADAAVRGLGNYFVGERVRVLIPAGTRASILVPARYISTRGGIDYVRLQQSDSSITDIPVQRGQARPTKDMPDAVEILSGLNAGDQLVLP